MVSKATATRGSVQAVDYIMNDKGQAVELDRNLIASEKPQDILSEMREVQEQNARCINNTYSIVLSPDSSQKQFTMDELKQLTRDHLKNLGLEKNQYIAYVHNSTDNQHVHIIANRIGSTGQAHNDQFISKKAQESAEKLAKDRGLYTAKEVAQMKSAQTADIRKQIKIGYTACAEKSTNMTEFKNNMNDLGFRVDLTENKSGKIQGFRIFDKHSELSFKASEIGKDVRYPKLIGQLNENKSIVEQAKQVLNTPRIANRIPTELLPITPIPAVDVAIKILKVAKQIVQILSKSQGIGY